VPFDCASPLPGEALLVLGWMAPLPARPCLSGGWNRIGEVVFNTGK